MNIWIATRGPLETSKRIKYMRLHVTKYFAGEPLLSPVHPSIGLTKDGLPRNISMFHEAIRRGTNDDIRGVLTALSISRAISCTGEPSFESIIAPYSGSIDDFSSFDQEIRSALSSMKIPTGIPPFEDVHLSTKSGPNCQTMQGSIIDVPYIPEDLLTDIYTIAPEIKSLIDNIKDNVGMNEYKRLFEINPKGLIRKLSIKPDPEGKARVIAISDYWSQCALKPLHDRIFAILREIRGDRTFTQTSPFLTLPKSGPYYSLDLSAATDRFPLKFQIRVIAILTGSEEYAKAWGRIMVKNEFDYQGKSHVYSCGQPMGLYSSWAVFSLSHHIIVRIASARTNHGFGWTKYALLGDDIVLTNKRVALKYKELISQLGVDIVPSKSHTSQDMCEFAKRWYKHGIEVSGIQLNSIANINGQWPLLANEFESLCSRMGLTSHDKPKDIILELMKIFDVQQGQFKYFNNYLKLPRVEDTVEIRLEKVQHLARVHFETISCNWKVVTLERLVLMLLAEVKAGVIQSSIVENSKKLNSFARYLLTTLPLGVDPTRTLLNLPIFRVVKASSIKLQEVIISLRKGYDDLSADLVYKDFLIPLIDPERVISKRVHSELVLTRASVIYKCRAHMADLRKTQKFIMREDTSPHALRIRE